MFLFSPRPLSSSSSSSSSFCYCFFMLGVMFLRCFPFFFFFSSVAADKRSAHKRSALDVVGWLDFQQRVDPIMQALVFFSALLLYFIHDWHPSRRGVKESSPILRVGVFLLSILLCSLRFPFSFVFFLSPFFVSVSFSFSFCLFLCFVT